MWAREIGLARPANAESGARPPVGTVGPVQIDIRFNTAERLAGEVQVPVIGGKPLLGNLPRGHRNLQPKPLAWNDALCRRDRSSKGGRGRSQVEIHQLERISLAG